MTDSQKLDLLLEKVGDLEGKMDGFEGRMDRLEGKVGGVEGKFNKLENLLIKSTSDLKAMDKMILSEVERVHDILNKHIADKAVHTA